MKKLLSMLLMVFLIMPNLLNGNYFGVPTAFEMKVVNFGNPVCKNIEAKDIPTIFIPGILASWYSQEGYGEAKVKRWIPDPITNVYDTLIHTFKQNGYKIEDVFYKDEFNIDIIGDPKQSLYLFGYDWKKDNKITATLLNKLISKIKQEYFTNHGCEPEVNIIAHSMGGLVARAMLEDMCIQDKYMSENSYYSDVTPGKIKSYKSVECSDYTKINKFITIATPHRGSPKSLSIWENGDMEKVETFITSLVLKGQLDSVFDTGLYEIIHGYEPNVPNGIISLGQLLPDIQNDNNYNNKLKYIFKKGFEIKNENYPKNSFLEELNKQENIDKMFDKINGKYTSYYSFQTGNKDENNVVGYNLKDSFTYYDDELATDATLQKDITQTINGKDIYDKYYSSHSLLDYNIDETIRNQTGLGGDGTVPTFNLLLVPNDSKDGKEVKNDKYESVEIKCYKNRLISSNFGDEEYIKENSSDIYVWLGTEADLEICSHSYMPIATAINVYDQISGEGIFLDMEDDDKMKISRKKLLEYVGNANYRDYYVKKYYDSDDYTWKFDYNNFLGIRNYTMLDEIFKDTYKPLFSLVDLKTEYKRIDNTLKHIDPLKVDLNFPGSLGKLGRTVLYDVRSPINLLITDSQGRRIGMDPETGMIINEIPGAWTSGDTEGSNEPEFFMIPVEGTGAVEHEIKTYGTGDGEYHIVLNDVDLDPETSSGTTEKLIIAGNAKQAFGEDYTVSIDETGEKTFENLTINVSPTIEIEKTDIKTDKANYKLRYNIRGNSENVGKLTYSLYFLPPEGGKVRMGESILNINGILNLNLKDIGKYKLVLELVDKDGNILKNPEATKTIYIEKQEQKQTITDKINSTQDVTFPEKDMSFVTIFNNDLHKVFNLYNNKENYFDAKIGFGINSSFDAKMSYDEKTGDVKVLLPNGDYASFSLQNDFTYKNDLDNDLQFERILNYFKVSSKGANYYFFPRKYLLEKIKKDEKEYVLHYNRSNVLESVDENKKLLFSFKYDDFTGLLTNIIDKYGNSLLLSYDKIDETYVLSKINSREVLYNNEGDIKAISGLLNDMFSTNASYTKKLEIIKQRIDSMNLNSYKRNKLMQAISKQKNGFISKIKDEYTKRLIEYFVGEIEKYLEE